MANVFLNGADRDVETAIMLEQAIVHNIGKAVAYTDGDRVFINTDDNLYNILPAYDHKMLKWLLWHERYHKELRHHNRFFRYLKELNEEDTLDEFHVTKDEVNIIMDILVHDSLAKLFPELVETAVNNLAQMRNRNSLSYTFKTFTLEEMLEEYAKHKKGEDEDKKEGEGEGDGEETKEDKDTGDKTKGKGKSKTDKKEKTDDSKDGDGKADDKKAHGEGGTDTPKPGEDKPEDGEPDIKEDSPEPEKDPLPSEHDKTDWSKLEEIDSKEFIETEEGDRYIAEINKLKRMKAKLGKLTETLNGLVTSVRHRTYTKPNPIRVGGGVVLKGSKPGRVALYLCFDASGSMGCEMETFKEIISKSIPQAMLTQTEWFSGHNNNEAFNNPKGRSYDYYKAQFKDFMKVYASGGYDDDGDRTIELCYLAEQKGFTPIGVTDGGGQISWSKPMLQKLQRTIFVGQNDRWLNKAKEINPRIQILSI